MLLMLPISLLFSVFGTPIIKVLFEGGSFDATASLLTGGVFAMYALGMTGFFILDFLGKAYFAMGKTRTPLIVTVGVLVGCLLLNGLGTLLFPQHVVLLAAGTSTALLIGGGVMYVYFCRKQNAPLPVWVLIRGILLSVLMALAVHVVYSRFVSLDSGKFELVMQCALLGVAGMLAYLLLMGRKLPTAEILRKFLGRTKS